MTLQVRRLERVLFPVGGMLKSEVRALAERHLKGCRVLTKPESMGVCFVGRKRRFSNFLEQFLEPSSGRCVGHSLS